MVDFIILSALASTMAHFLRERQDRKDGDLKKTLREYQEYLRRSEHAEIVAMLLAQHDAQAAIAESLKTAKEYQQEQLSSLKLRIESLLSVHLRQFLSSTDRLTRMPRSRRVQIDVPLIGRHPELKTLDTLFGENCDTVIIGQPGAGKTYLAHRFAQLHDGWFVHSSGTGMLSEALRLHRPKLLVVDDAAIKSDLIAEIRQIRREFELKFTIVAVGWPPESDAIRGSLGCSANAVVELLPTSRNDLVNILNHVGLTGPPSIISHIVDQSRNRPGLAVTLADTALRHEGGWAEIWRGDAIATQIKGWFGDRLPDDTLLMLSISAFAGGEGFSMEQISHWLGLTLWQVQGHLKTLAPAGIIEVRTNRKIVVVPESLRFPLMQEHFFCGPASIEWEPYADALENRAELCLNLIGLVARGVEIDANLLLDQLSLISPSERTEEGHHPWTAYCYLGPSAVRTCIDRFPDEVDLFARPGLETAPEIAIPWLFSQSMHDEPRRSHALGAILGWMKSQDPADDSALRSRLLVIKSASNARTHGIAPTVASDLAIAAMSPSYSLSHSDPGSHRTVSISTGTLAPQDLSTLGTEWPKVLALFSICEPRNWKSMLELVSDWSIPEFHLHLVKDDDAGRKYKERVRQAMIPVCETMVSDMSDLAKDNPAVRHQLSDLAKRTGLSVRVPTDDLFEVFFYDPVSEDDWKSAETEHAKRIEEIAAEWSSESPDTVAEWLHKLESEAQQVGTYTHDWPSYVCRCISANVNNVLDWSHAFVRKQCSNRLLAPFLERMVTQKPRGWEDRLSELLSIDRYELEAIGLLLRTDDAPISLRQTAFQRAEKVRTWLLGFCARRELSQDTIKSLLSHESSDVRSEICRGILLLYKEKDIPQDVFVPWKAAVIETVDEDYILAEVIERFPEISEPWLRTRISNAQTPWYQFKQSLPKAVRALTEKQRLELLSLFPDGGYHRQVIQVLVGDDPQIYSRYLDLDPPRYDRTWPLHRLEFPNVKFSTDAWLAKAVVALDHGIEPGEIAYAALYPGASYSRGAALWDERIEWYESMLNHDDPRIHDVGLAGIEMAKKQHKRDDDEERRIDLEGL